MIYTAYGDDTRKQLESLENKFNPMPVEQSPLPTIETIQPKELSVAPSNFNVGKLVGNYGNMAGSAMTSLAQGINAGRENEFNNANYSDPAAAKDQAFGQVLTSAKSTIGSAFGPAGSLIAGASSLGGAIGDSIGGDAGTAVSTLFAPDQAIASTWNDPDMDTGEKVLGTLVPFYGAFKSKRNKEKRKQEEMKRRATNERIQETVRREADQRMQEGMDQVANLSALKKAQLGILSSNY